MDPRDPIEHRIHLSRLDGAPESEMDAEIDAHIQLRIDDLIAQGLSPVEARAAAERRFGDMKIERRNLRHAARKRDTALRHRDRFGAIVGDIRFGLRQIRRSPSHSALVIATLALGIGLTTAMFTLLERVLLNPLPFPHAEQLVAVRGRDSVGVSVSTVSDDDWLDWKAGTSVFSAFAAYNGPFRNTVPTGDSAIRMATVAASGEFFAALQPHFILGRPFTSDDARAGLGVAVVSERVWRNVLGADRSLSKGLPWGSRTLQVIGVVADGSEFPAGTDLWLQGGPVRGPGGGTRNNINWRALARLKPGVTPAQATRDLSRVSVAIRARDRGGFYDFGGIAEPLLSDVVSTSTASSLRLLMECVVVVLLLVCANLTIATLGRGAARSREIAVRGSLGASRRRLIVQLLVEHLMLAGAGGIVGLVVAWATVRILVSAWADSIPRAAEVRLDVRVVAFAAGASILVGLLAGVIPAVRGTRVSLQSLMKHGGRGAVGGGLRIATMLVIAEFALALTLMTGAGLLIRSLQTLVARDLGFNRQLATVQLVLPGARYGRDSLLRTATWDRLVEAYRTIPGVDGVGLANQIPLGSGYSGFIDLPDREGLRIGAGYRTANEDYFRTLGLRIVRGRVFATSDAAGPRVVVINQAMARAYWPDTDPVGKMVRARSMEGNSAGVPADWLTIIGVVSDVRQFGPESEFAPEMYVFFRQGPQQRTTSMSLVVHANIPPKQLLPMLRARTREVDPGLAPEISTMSAALSETLSERQLTMSLLAGFAVLALVLAALGIYAVLSYTVVQRRRELAMRSALGAQRSDLLSMVLWKGVRAALAGMLIGVVAAAAISRIMRAMLVDLGTLDLVALAGASSILGLVAVTAILIPALRATRVDPLMVLNSE